MINFTTNDRRNVLNAMHSLEKLQRGMNTDALEIIDGDTINYEDLAHSIEILASLTDAKTLINCD